MSTAILIVILILSASVMVGVGATRLKLYPRGWREPTDRPLAATDYLTDPPKSLNYNYIDWLERDLKVGKYDPDRIALGFDDTEPKTKPKPLDPEIDDLPMPDAVEVDERCPCVACRSKRRDASRVDTEHLGRVAKAKPVDDSWADVDVRRGAREPEPRGLVRRIVDNHGNWTEIRSFGG